MSSTGIVTPAPLSTERTISAAVQKHNKYLATIKSVTIDMARIPEEIVKELVHELQKEHRSNVPKTARIKRSLDGERVVVGSILLEPSSSLPVGTVPLPPFTKDILFSNALSDTTVFNGVNKETFVSLYGDLLSIPGETEAIKMLVLSSVLDPAI